jgi:hypothetical protein
MPSYHWRETAVILIYSIGGPFSLMRMPSIGEAGWAGPPLARGGVGRYGRVKRGFVFPIRPMGRLASSFTGNI